MTFDYRDLTEADLHRLRELDRSEHVTTTYATDSGSPGPRAVDWDDSGWHDGDGEHSFAHQIDFCRGHVGAGARVLGCFTPPDQLVGIGVMRPGVEPRVAQLAFLHVSHAYRRHGIGTGLLDRLMAWAQGTGARELYVSATPSHSAVSFYQRGGSRVTDRPIEELLALEPEDIHLRRRL